MSTKALGKGLGALFPDDPGSTQNSVSLLIPATDIVPNAVQPRKSFDADAMNQLADSVRQHGILQPLAVRRLSSGKYQIIAGERRWRAANMAGLTELPVIVIDADDRHAMELALIENLQREDLNPIEEAEGYKALIEDFGLTQEDASLRVGKSRPAVANALRLLALPERVLSFLKSGDISSGHARALLQLHDEEQQFSLTRKIIKAQMSVRDTEKYVKYLLDGRKTGTGTVKNEVSAFLEEVEIRLSTHLGRRVKIVPGKSKGKFEVEYYGPDDLKLLISLFDKIEDTR